MRTRYVFLLLAPLAGIGYFAQKECDSRITVLNGSGHALTSVRLEAEGVQAQVSENIPAAGEREIVLSGFAAGPYQVKAIFAEGESDSATLGYLDPRTAFRDTLFINPPSE